MVDVGRLDDGATLQDHGRRLVGPDLPLTARWVRTTRNDGVDNIAVTVPIPVRVDHPMRTILLAYQHRMMAKWTEDFSETSDSGRVMPREEPLPMGTWRWRSHTLMELTWWSDRLVSGLEWQVAYTGGAHSNTCLRGHAWRLGSDGAWGVATLTDLLGDPSVWRDNANAFIVADLKRQMAAWFIHADPPIRPADEDLFEVWSVAGDGLVVSFAPYIAGPYSQGVFQVRVPWAELGAFRPNR
jgi:hypothetical protein